MKPGWLGDTAWREALYTSSLLGSPAETCSTLEAGPGLLENLAQASMISPLFRSKLEIFMAGNAAKSHSSFICHSFYMFLPYQNASFVRTELRTLVTNGEAKRIWVLSLDVLNVD